MTSMRLLPSGVLLAALLLGTLVPATHAAVFSVTKTADTNDGACNADCSLREAVLASNAATPGPNVISVPAGTYQLTINFSSQTCDLSSPCPWDVAHGTAGALYFSTTATIQGAGARYTIIHQTVQDRVIEVEGASASIGTTIQDVAIEGGRHGGLTLNYGGVFVGSTVGYGGGAHVGANSWLSLVRVAVLNNTAYSGVRCQGTFCNSMGSSGGGIAGDGAVYLLSSLVANNQALTGFFQLAQGLGIVFRSTGSIRTSTVAGNGDPIVIGDYQRTQILACGGEVTVEDSTLVADEVPLQAVFETALWLPESPFYVISENTRLVVRNSIVAGSGCSDTARSQMAPSLGHNIDEDGSCSLQGALDVTGDPKLGPLANGGGQTDTMALLAGSPAIDTGDPFNTYPTDQTGAVRPQDGDHNGTKVNDRGAYEARATPTGCGHVAGGAAPNRVALSMMILSASLVGRWFRKAPLKIIPTRKRMWISRMSLTWSTSILVLLFAVLVSPVRSVASGLSSVGSEAFFNGRR